MKWSAISVGGALLVACVGQVASASEAANYPTKPIRIIVGHSPGGIDDVWARRYAMQMSERLKQPVVVDNKPGASGTLAMTELLKSPNDGYTLLFGGMASLIQFPSAGGVVRYNPKTDVEPVAIGTLGYPVLVAGSNSWAKTVQDIVAKGKENKNNSLPPYSCGTSGQASASHFVCAMISKRMGLQFNTVPYKSGSLAATDAASGHVDFAAGFYGEINPLTSGKRLTPLMVFSPKRIPLYPDTPTVKEAGFPDLEMVSFSAFYAPKGTPKDIREKLNKVIIASFHTPQMERWLSDAGAFYEDYTPDQLGEFYRKEIDLWTKRSKDNDIRVEQ